MASTHKTRILSALAAATPAEAADAARAAVAELDDRTYMALIEELRSEGKIEAIVSRSANGQLLTAYPIRVIPPASPTIRTGRRGPR